MFVSLIMVVKSLSEIVILHTAYSPLLTAAATIHLPILSTLAPTSSRETQELKELEVVPNITSEGDGMPTLGDIVTTYTISDTIPPSLASLTTLTTSSTLESVFNEPIMSVAVTDSETNADISSVLQS